MEEALVTRAGIPFAGIHTGQLRGINPLKAAGNVGKMMLGVRESRALIKQFRPTVCLVTGGYVCAPVAFACRTQHIPVMIYLPDMIPGSAIRSLSRLADQVAVSFPEVAPHFGGEIPVGKAVVTGYPVRQELVHAAQDRPAARRELAQRLGRPLAETAALPLVLVWGGSQGSRMINRSTWQALPDLLPYAHVLHVVGTRDWPLYQEWSAAEPLSRFTERYHPVAYLHEDMPWALAAADLTVARAGASSLGEFPVAGLPSVLVPLPHAGVNQQVNAELLVSRGAAVVVQDNALSTELTPALLDLLQHPARLETMAQAAADLAQPNAARQIAHALAALQRSST